jgi:glycine betaine/choline ABC-type transport system substrate-binding protein
LLSVLEVKTLRDDQRYFPPYECAVVVRQETLQRHSKLQSALDELTGRLDSRTMQGLNWAVDANSKTAPEAAADFLRSLR